jgi:hypothetical protein
MCSGSLIGCSTFLTAAHCIADDPDPRHYKVFFQHAGFFDVTEIHWQKDKYMFPIADVAILKLAEPVEGVPPLAINRATKPINGSRGQIIGFGRTGGDNADYGIKRTGFVETAECEPPRSNTALICWKYAAIIKTPGEDSNTCSGDSGGSLQIDGDPTLAGVTSGGLRKDCLGGDRSYDANVFEYRSWIDAVTRADQALKTCGKAIDFQRSVFGEARRLSAASPQASFDIYVPPGTSQIRVTMNGEDDGAGKNDFDLFLFQGRGSSSPAACGEDRAGQFAFCDIKNPFPGDWTIVVRRKKGEGLMQTVVTMIRD